MLKRISRLAGGRDVNSFVMPHEAIVASHHMELAVAGRVGITIMLAQEKGGRHVTVVTVGRRTPEPIVRIHSSCLYGETLGSLECDCGEQLREALSRMRKAGSGILVYLHQEGRGAGLTVKALAHELAERLDFDAHGAYVHLGFQHDLRSYADAVRALRLLGINACVLLTNNPAKVAALEAAGIVVRREALRVRAGAPENQLPAGRGAHSLD